MSNNKWNKEDLNEASVTAILEPEETKVDGENNSTQGVSGSTSVAVSKTIKVEDSSAKKESVKINVETQNSSFDISKKVSVIPESLIIPIESWPTRMNKSELKAYKEYQRSQFPELFEIKNIENDRASEVPFLKLTKPDRIFASFLETAVKIQEEEKKKKVIH